MTRHLSVSIGKNSLNNFLRELRGIGEGVASVKAQTELFKKYFQISLKITNDENPETSSFEETLKNIKLKTQNIVEVEKPVKQKERKRKIKSELTEESEQLIGDSQIKESARKMEREMKIKNESLEKTEIATRYDHIVDKKEKIDETLSGGDGHHEPCSNSSCNKEACKRFIMKQELEDISHFEVESESDNDGRQKNEEFSQIRKEDFTECPECSFKAASFWTLKVHMEMIHLEMRWLCVLCNYNTKEKYILRKHIKNDHQTYHPDHLDYHCIRCNVQGPIVSKPSKVSYREHIAANHSSLLIFYQSQKKSEKGPFQCKFCSQILENRTLYQSHLESVHMSIQYFCSLCDYKARGKISIRNHVSRSHSQAEVGSLEAKRFVRDNITRECIHCDNKQLQHKENLEEHILKNHPDKFTKLKRKTVKDPSKLIQCNFCDFTSEVRGNLRTHVMLKHIQARFECRKCSVQFKNLPLLRKHIRAQHGHTEDSDLIKSSCGVCHFSADSLRDFRLHFTEKHFPYIKNDPSTSRKKQKSKKKKERKIRHDKKPTFLCRDCNISTFDKTEIIEHVIEKHDLAEQEENKEQFEIINKISVSCISCSFTGSFSEYSDHMTASLAARLVCSQCGSHAEDEKELADHLLTTHRGCRYSCPSCDYSHTSRRAVVGHSKREHGKGSFVYRCGLCPVFGSQTVLLDHWEESHHQQTEIKTEEALGRCQYCGYQHISQDKMKDHVERFHKIFTCKDCSEEFYTRKKLEYHIFKNHQNFTFNCEKCEFKTKHESALYRHTNSIHGKVQPLPCRDCGKLFNRKDNLAVHRRNVHTK